MTLIFCHKKNPLSKILIYFCGHVSCFHKMSWDFKDDTKFNVSYTHNSTLMTVVPFRGFGVIVPESLIRDIGIASEWCDLLGIKLNASKTKTVIVSKSRTMHPQSPPLTIGG